MTHLVRIVHLCGGAMAKKVHNYDMFLSSRRVYNTNEKINEFFKIIFLISLDEQF